MQIAFGSSASISTSTDAFHKSFRYSSERKYNNKLKNTDSYEKIVKVCSTASSPKNANEASSNSIDDTSFSIDNSQHTTSFVGECDMPTLYGNFRMRSYTYTSSRVYLEPIVMISGDVRNKENVIVRVHDQCFTSEVFGSMRCDCRDQLQKSLQLIKQEDGIVIYLQQEGRGIGMANKVAAYQLQDAGFDTVDANLQLGFKDEMREYLCVPDILSDLGIKSIRLVTNNPYKMEQISGLGIKINERLNSYISPNRYNLKYMRSKRDRMRHYLPDNGTLKINETNLQSASNPHEAATSSHEASASENVPTSQVKDDVVTQRSDLKESYALGRDTVLAAIDAIGRGEIVIVVDDENRENEGDLIMAADLATPDAIGFMVRHTSGVICVSLESDRLNELKLPPMVVNNEDPKQTAYTVSVDYKHGTTTGISSADRAACFRALVDPTKTHEDFQRPGHVFPLRYKPGGVIARGGHTEASLDLCKLAGRRPGGVLAEVVHDDGSLKRLPELLDMAKQYNLVITSVQDITAYRLELLRESK